MIAGADVVRMARYDRWQNQNLSGAADRLRDCERGAFWGSIDATFNHLSWGDGMGMNRLAGTPRLAVRPFNQQTQSSGPSFGGQAYCLLTQAGEHRPDTDLPFMPE